jgi:hypothetical protein
MGWSDDGPVQVKKEIILSHNCDRLLKQFPQGFKAVSAADPV